MRDCPARHVPCGAHHGHGLKEEGSPYEQQARADALHLSRAYVRIQDAYEGSAEEGEQEGEGKASLRARAVQKFSTQRFYSTASGHRREEPLSS
jgi:hypothetical protein